MPAVKTETLIEALLKAQQELPEIATTTQGQSGAARYLYAKLPDILREVLPVLHKHNFVLTQQAVEKEGTVWMETNLLHTSGEKLSSEVPLPMPTNWQQWGSAVTYARRYSLTAILGIAPDDDDDAASAQGFGGSSARPKAQPAAEHGVCPEHNVPWRPATAKQIAAGHPEPWHKDGDGFCKKEAPVSTESEARREAMEVLSSLFSDANERKAYIKDVLEPKQINHPDDITDDDWRKVKAAAEGDLAAMVPEDEQLDFDRE